jgi:hypothetical protein
MASEEKKGLLGRLIADRTRRMEEQTGGLAAPTPEQEEPEEQNLPISEEFEALLDASPISARRYLQEKLDKNEISAEKAGPLVARLPDSMRSEVNLYPNEEVDEYTYSAALDPSAAKRRLMEGYEQGDLTYSQVMSKAKELGLSEEIQEGLKKQIKEYNEYRYQGSSVEEGAGAAGLAQAYDPEFDEAFEGHPGFQALEADEPAGPELENELIKKVVNVREYLFNEGNYPKVLARLNVRTEDFFEAAADTAFHIALAEHNKATGRGEIENPAVYFCDGALLSSTVDMLFEVAQHHEIPGSQDPNQYAAAMGYAWQKAGEYIMENGDETSIAEAQEIMADVALTREDGSMVETREDAMAVRRNRQRMQEQDAAALAAGQAAMPEESFASPRAVMGQLPGGIG